MVPGFKRILYATDLSKNSNYAFRYAATCAKLHKAEIVILHVIEAMPPSVQTYIDSTIDAVTGENHYEKAMNASIERIKQDLRDFCNKELENYTLDLNNITIKVRKGYPAEEILKASQEFNCDIIVMANHGKGVISHSVLGSIPKRVLRHSKIPVIVVPLPDEE